MKTTNTNLLSIISATSLILVTSINQAHADMASLVGKWQGEYKNYVYHEDGTHIGHAKMKLNIIEQNGCSYAQLTVEICTRKI